MMHFLGKLILASGTAAMLATTPLPLLAAEMASTPTASSQDHILNQTSDGHRRRWRHRDRVDAGDVLTGIGILAGIAIIAGAASDTDKRNRNEPRYDNRNEDRQYEDRREDDPRVDSQSGVYRDDDLGTAVSLCTNAAERSVGNGARVNEIRSVTSENNGWRVEGDIDNEAFTCATANGQIDYIRVNNRNI
jgi:hypothetical protein